MPILNEWKNSCGGLLGSFEQLNVILEFDAAIIINWEGTGKVLIPEIQFLLNRLMGEEQNQRIIIATTVHLPQHEGIYRVRDVGWQANALLLALVHIVDVGEAGMIQLIHFYPCFHPFHDLDTGMITIRKIPFMYQTEGLPSSLEVLQ